MRLLFASGIKRRRLFRISLICSNFVTLKVDAQHPAIRFVNVMKRFSLFFIISAFAVFCFSQPKHEVRAVWLTTIGGIDWPHSYARSASSAERQKGELRAILDRLQRANINTVLLQTRVRGTMIYPSDYEPWDGCLSGVPGLSPGYDALQYAVEECHRRGMELHAWVVTIPVGRWNGLGCRRLRKRFPGLVRRIGDEGFMNPESSRTAEYLADICAEITRRYDIDGIHLDYIRYPETWRMNVSREEGRRHITDIVRAVSSRVKALKPWVKMSCSPIGKYSDLSRYDSNGWNAYTRVCQDAQGWLREGLMDELFPMMYFRGDNFFPFAVDWAENSNGRIVVPGLGIYFMSPSERDWSLSDITRELEVVRSLDMGHAYFRSKFFTDNVKGIYDYASDVFCPYPALVPPMTWESSSLPSAPYGLAVKADTVNNVTMLSWNHSVKDSAAVLFNVYSSRSCPVDVDDARNLIVVNQRGRSVIVPSDPSRHYAVTAIDRYGNESAALQEHYASGADSEQGLDVDLLECDGSSLTLPSKGGILDASFLTIEDMTGRIVATRPYVSRYADVSALDEGVYVLRSLGRKGVNHRLGTFIIKRH